MSKTPLCTTVALYWVTYIINGIASKEYMIGFMHTDEYESDSHASTFLQAFLNLWWVELTTLQFLFVGLVSFLWLKYVQKESISVEPTERRSLLTISAINVLGHLARNASYAAITSDVTELILALQVPLTFTIFTLLSAKTPGKLNWASVLLMTTSASGFVMWKDCWNTWGISAALIASVCFAFRNIYFQEPKNTWKYSVRTVTILSLCGFFLLSPVLVIKLIKFSITSRVLPTLISCTSTLGYTIVSVYVMDASRTARFTIIDFLKGILAIFFSVICFAISLNEGTVISLSVFLLGAVLYITTLRNFNFTFRTKSLLLYTTVITCIITPGFLYQPYQVKTTTPVYSGPIRTIRTLWIYNQAIPGRVIQNIESWTRVDPSIHVHVHCGTTPCMSAVQGLNNRKITTSFQVVTELDQLTTLRDWFYRHPFHKLLSGVHFEHHLQQAVGLALSWHHGQTYISPIAQLEGNKVLQNVTSTVAISSDKDTPGVVGLFNFPKEHVIVSRLAEQFITQYKKQTRSGKYSAETVLDFVNVERIPLCQLSYSCARIVTLDTIGFPPKQTQHFRTFSYGSTARVNPDNDFEEEFQEFANLQFLPFVDLSLDGEELEESEKIVESTSFFNAWWSSGTISFPSSKKTRTIMISIHLPNNKPIFTNTEVEYLRLNGPIGCRDRVTCQILRQNRLDSFFSGCITLLLSNPIRHRKRTEDILLVDLDKRIKTILPRRIQDTGISMIHHVKEDVRLDYLYKLRSAMALIERYSRAKLVVTQRISCALICVSLRTPVVFVMSPNMPESKSTLAKVKDHKQLFHSLDTIKLSSHEAKTWLSNFNWSKPSPKTDINLLKRLRAIAWNQIRKYKPLHDSARKFGIIPFPDLRAPDQKQILFHLIFTTSAKSSLVVFTDNSKISGAFNWRHWRCIEAIFYHHPHAHVIVHSNSLPNDTFDVLSESGYDIQVRRYNLGELIVGTPAEKFLGCQYTTARGGPYWYSHKTDLLRMLLLYKHGGIYMDTDIHVVRNLEKLPKNVVGYESEKYLNGAFIKFEKQHPFLMDCLKHFSTGYKALKWGANGPGLISELLLGNRTYSDVRILNQTAFYMFRFDDVLSQCFEETSGKNFTKNWKKLEDKAFVVHLNSKISGAQGLKTKVKNGTICKHILNAFCIFCDKTY